MLNDRNLVEEGVEGDQNPVELCGGSSKRCYDLGVVNKADSKPCMKDEGNRTSVSMA